MTHTVLIVDDAATVRMYHGKIMRQAGFEVEEAVNGYEALEKILQKSYDLLLVDVNMPKMDGYTFLTKLRKMSELVQPPAIMISTESKTSDEETAYRAGANLYLVKPLKPEQLSAAARMIVGVTA